MGKITINLDDLIGKKFNKLTILSATREYDNSLQRYIMCKCQCECGKVIMCRYNSLIKNATKSCGCIQRKNLDTLIGKVFGRLTVISAERRKQGTHYRIYCKCQCECGNIKEIVYDALRIGKTKSCGCNRKSKQDKLKLCQEIKLKLYKIYYSIKTRCYNRKTYIYKYYGGKGIKICDEWLNNFNNFYQWALANNYRINFSIDRININDNYCPENCRWIPRNEQNNNKGNNLAITINNETKTLSQWCKKYHANYSVVLKRINVLKWEPLKALTTPVRNWDGNKDQKLLNIWRSIHDRCYNENNQNYNNYGGKGIKICDEWLNNFEVFQTWALDNGFNNSLSIDRINNDGNYEPTNCRWATAKIQNNNRTNNKYITINNETKTLQEWCNQYKIDYKLCYSRIYQLKWEPLRALTTLKNK